MPYVWSQVATDALPDDHKCVQDLRAAPVRNRHTLFRLLQQNMLAYTFDSFVPGFSLSGVVNDKAFTELVEQPTVNARREGAHRFAADFALTREQVAKVEGDIFEILDATVLWNAAAMWNAYMVSGVWPRRSAYTKPPPALRRSTRQVAVLSLPRNYDWVLLLTPRARQGVDQVRDELATADLLLPTSTPDVMIVVLPDGFREGPPNGRFTSALPDLGLTSQTILADAHLDLEGRIEADEFVLGVAIKKSLRSDRLYQPLYEANVMQLLLETKLRAPHLDFEVHTLEAAGTAAVETYRAASLPGVATNDPDPHRAVRDLYRLARAPALAQRLLSFLEQRMAELVR
jgi:hypothetical protein